MKVWKRDRVDRALGVHCPECDRQIELRGTLPTKIEDGHVLSVACPTCRKNFDVDMAAIGGYLWAPTCPKCRADMLPAEPGSQAAWGDRGGPLVGFTDPRPATCPRCGYRASQP